MRLKLNRTGRIAGQAFDKFLTYFMLTIPLLLMGVVANSTSFTLLGIFTGILASASLAVNLKATYKKDQVMKQIVLTEVTYTSNGKKKSFKI